MSIVNININTQTPPKPSRLLQSGVMVSAGGSTLDSGKGQWVASASAAEALILPSMDIASIAWASNAVTVTLSNNIPAGFGATEKIIVSGVQPEAYNGTYTATVNRDDGTLTYDLFTDPGASTTNGMVTSAAANELTEMVTSFFKQGKTRQVYILETAGATTTDSVATLKSFIAQDVELGFVHQQYFAYLIPRAFSSNTDFQALASSYLNPNDLIYFFVTGSSETYESWATSGWKSVFFLVDSPTKLDGEFSCANAFQSMLANEPSASSMVPPMSYRFMYGATAYPAAGNAVRLKQFQQESVNYIGTGAEGGLYNTILVAGHTLDGKPLNYWYAVAWSAINLAINLANEIINGSNSTLNPLYYEQRGIKRLQRRALSTLRSGVSYGLLLGEVFGTDLTQEDFVNELDKGTYAGQLVINAINFTDYNKLNPNDFSEGVYNGLSAVVTPRNGFESITFNLNVTNFVGA